MYHYTIYQWLLFFYIYSFIGWCYECTYVGIRNRHWENRGFLHGPYLPLYGNGALAMLIISRPFSGNLILTYVAGCVGATLLELLTGIVMENLFKVRYWDYSDRPFNYKGYIFLYASLFWGVLTVLMTFVVHTKVERVVVMIPQQYQQLLVLGITAVYAVDFGVSLKAALDLREILIRMEETRLNIAAVQTRLASVMEKASEQVRTSVGQKKQQLGAVREEWSEVCENIGPEMLAGWEEKISGLQSSMDESAREKLTAVRKEYHELKGKLEESRQIMENITKFANVSSLYHIKNNSDMISRKFMIPFAKIKEEMAARNLIGKNQTGKEGETQKHELD